MIIDVESLRSLCTDDTITLTNHAAVQLMNRNIKYKHIKMAMKNGEIIEEYHDEYPNPRILVMGYVADNKPLHVIVGVGDWNLQIITAYYPSLDRWEADYRTRRVMKR